MKVITRLRVAERDCIFCRIVAGRSPAWVVGESEAALAILDINPVTPGHTLVLPKRHAEDIWAVSAGDFAAVAELARSMAAVLDERLTPDGLTLFQANRGAGWQDVFHLHVHVVPRATDDDLVRPWVSSPDGRDALEAVHRTVTFGRDVSSWPER
jgi:histidine triad (HIT) family protein